MADLLVNLLKLPALPSGISELNDAGIIIRRAQPFEITAVREFIEVIFESSFIRRAVQHVLVQQREKLGVVHVAVRALELGARDEVRRNLFETHARVEVVHLVAEAAEVGAVVPRFRHAYCPVSMA